MQRNHTPHPPRNTIIAAVGEKIRFGGAAVDGKTICGRYACLLQHKPVTRQQVELTAIPAGGWKTGFAELCYYFFAYFVICRADALPYRHLHHLHIGAELLHGADGMLCDFSECAFPARMRRTDDVVYRIVKEDGITIGRTDGEYKISFVCYQRIAGLHAGFCRTHRYAVHLVQTRHTLRIAAEGGDKTAAVFVDMFLHIIGSAQVERTERLLRNAAVACAEGVCTRDVWRA